MKLTIIQYVLCGFLVSALSTNAQALSQKNKAVIKSGILGTVSGLVAAGAAKLTYDQFDNCAHMLNVAEAANDNANRRLLEIIGYNSACTALFTGYVTLKAAQKAAAYFRQVKQDIGRQEIDQALSV